jgi:hypothetical protein
MNALTKFSIVAGLTCLMGPGELGAQDCDPQGDVQFVCGPSNPEDLVRLPEESWVIASGMEDNGHLYRVDTRDHTTDVVFPTDTSTPRFDRETYGACPGPGVEEFRPHGLSLRPGPDGLHTLYVVRHGLRESVEVFEVDASQDAPTLTWVGCVVAPEGVGLNSVAALPETGFAATNFQRPVGEVWEWQPDAGWAKVPGSETSGPNGLVAAPDGRWLFIGGWGTQSLIRLSRGKSEPQTDSVDVGFHIDNVRWGPDGSLFAAGHRGDSPEAIFECLGQGRCDSVTSRVAKVDPETLEAEEIIRYPSDDVLTIGTVAIQVDDEIWVGGIGGGDRIIRFVAPTP